MPTKREAHLITTEKGALELMRHVLLALDTPEKGKEEDAWEELAERFRHMKRCLDGGLDMPPATAARFAAAHILITVLRQVYGDPGAPINPTLSQIVELLSEIAEEPAEAG